jgi:hypothetical protein
MTNRIQYLKQMGQHKDQQFPGSSGLETNDRSSFVGGTHGNITMTPGTRPLSSYGGTTTNMMRRSIEQQQIFLQNQQENFQQRF